MGPDARTPCKKTISVNILC